MILTSDPHALVSKFLSFLPELEENALPDKNIKYRKKRVKYTKLCERRIWLPCSADFKRNKLKPTLKWDTTDTLKVKKYEVEADIGWE